MCKEEIKPPHKGMEGTYHIAKSYIEVQCSCGNYVVFREDSTLINATFCPRCKNVVERPKDSCQKNG